MSKTPAAPPRPEFPRPDMARARWQSLNGRWEFAFDPDDSLEGGGIAALPLDGEITVPFCYQSAASGIGQAQDCRQVWYRRQFAAALPEAGGRVLLRFGAVDYQAKVWLNGQYLGGHQGGHTPFHFEVGGLLAPHGQQNTLVVKATDSPSPAKPRGKQSWTGQPFACWYTPTTGIWQSVWLEYTGGVWLEQLKLTPDAATLTAECEFFLANEADAWVEVRAFEPGQGPPEEARPLLAQQRVRCTGGYGRCVFAFRDLDLRDDELLWAPEHPNLIPLEVKVEGDGAPDVVRSYLGLRSVACSRGQVLLNGRPYFQRLVLDQGYWPESLLTPPSDEALVEDIRLTKAMGFNGARKHQKPEDPRYYYWADRLGLLVWGEMPSAYAFNDLALRRTAAELEAFLRRDHSHPCIVAWVPVNESWGMRNIDGQKRQRDACRMLLYLCKSLDPSRPVSANDGWEQIGETDICAIHDYSLMAHNSDKYARQLPELLKGFAERRMLFAQGESYGGQPVMLTEFGGLAFAGGEGGSWGYYDAAADEADFLARLQPVVTALREDAGLAGYCYTQLTDVMQEVNGLLTAQRRPKAAPEALAQIFGPSRVRP